VAISRKHIAKRESIRSEFGVADLICSLKRRARCRAGKLVLPRATGGSQSHMLALDYALRPVLHALAAKHVLTSIYATSEQLEWSTAWCRRRRSPRASAPASRN
jgi:hypothetical protein